MGALADAALEAGGNVVGIIPHFMAKLERAHLGLTKLTLVEDMQTRKREMLMQGDAFIALPGGVGTLEELMEALEWTCSGRHSKPVGVLNVDGIYTPLLDMLNNAVREGFMPEVCLQCLVVAGTPTELLVGIEQSIGNNSLIFHKAPTTTSSAIAVEKPVSFAAHDALAVIVDEGIGRSLEHRRAVEEFAQLAANGASRIVVNGHGRRGSLSWLFVSTLLDANADVAAIIEATAHREVPPGLRTLDVVSANREELGQDRKRLFFEHGAEFVALPGGVAVWEELLELISASCLGLHKYPMGILNSGGFFTPFLELLANTIKAGFTAPEVMTYIVTAEAPADLLNQLRCYNPSRVVRMVKPAPHQLSSRTAKL